MINVSAFILLWIRQSRVNLNLSNSWPSIMFRLHVHVNAIICSLYVMEYANAKVPKFVCSDDIYIVHSYK